MIGPRITGNYNIYNEKNLTISYNGIGVGIGGTVDISFTKHIGVMGNITFFDMRNFSNVTTTGNSTDEVDFTFTYLAIDPMFKAEFSGFYMVLGPSVGIKLAASGEETVSTTGANAATNVTPRNVNATSIVFDIATGAGYTFTLSQNSMYLGTDFMVYIPLSSTFNVPGLTNSEFTMKFGVTLKFKI
jgi:hypothetical protein